MYLVKALVPSDTACLASSPGRRLISLINKPYQDTGTLQLCQKATGRRQVVAGTPAIGPVGVPYGNMAERSYCSTPFPYDCWLKIVRRLPITSYKCTQLYIHTPPP